jgi:hypothetical protein
MRPTFLRGVTGGAASEIENPKQLLDSGVITQAELYAIGRSRLSAGQA